MNKADMKAELTARGVDFKEDATNDELKELLKNSKPVEAGADKGDETPAKDTTDTGENTDGTSNLETPRPKLKDTSASKSAEKGQEWAGNHTI